MAIAASPIFEYPAPTARPSGAREVKDTVVRTCIAVEPEMSSHVKSPLHSPAFEIYGFDILIDQTLQPWVLEVPRAPSVVH